MNSSPEYEVVNCPVEVVPITKENQYNEQTKANELYAKYLEIERDSGNIICLTCVDIILNFSYFIIYFYQILISFFFFCIGYNGADTRNMSKIKCYMIYQSAQFGIKFMGLLFLITLKANTIKRIEFRINNPNNPISGKIDTLISLTILNLFFHINFLCYLRKYYNLLPLLKKEPNYIIL
tara:strand:- start:90 stop:629 length:540 start_codon:yes stop_codon:yes gene_type:complete